MAQSDITRSEAPNSLWARSRQLATQDILETALRLFTEQGYDETSIAQIAREAGVSQRTLFRYFGSKEDLLGGNQLRFGQVIGEAMREQPAEADAWEALRAGIAAAQSLHAGPEQALERFRLLHGTASLRAAWLEKQLRFQDALLPLVKPRMDPAVSRTDATARAVIATVFACLDAATMAWVDVDGKGNVMDLYDDCLETVRGRPRSNPALLPAPATGEPTQRR